MFKITQQIFHEREKAFIVFSDNSQNIFNINPPQSHKEIYILTFRGVFCAGRLKCGRIDKLGTQLEVFYNGQVNFLCLYFFLLSYSWLEIVLSMRIALPQISVLS